MVIFGFSSYALVIACDADDSVRLGEAGDGYVTDHGRKGDSFFQFQYLSLRFSNRKALQAQRHEPKT